MNTLLIGTSRFLADDTGVTAIEYGLLTALISVVIIAAVTTVGRNLNTMFETISVVLLLGAFGF